MATALITITNSSKQAVPILVNEIPANRANANSDVAPAVAQQMSIASGAEITIEARRVDTAQLEQLRRKGLISFTAVS